MEQIAAALSVIMGVQVDIPTTVRIVDALAGLAGQPDVDPATKARVGADMCREWLTARVTEWEARHIPPINLG